MLSNRRSSLFDEYLRAQPLERRKQIMAAEKEYAANRAGALVAVEEIFGECMSGRSDSPAGHKEDAAQALLLDTSHVFGGDWSWRPYRYAKDPGHIFTDAEIEALYPNREYRPNARLA
jgi:hypothetical protein